jgi:uncharacterized membrane protein YidH (DUF202 family)
MSGSSRVSVRQVLGGFCIGFGMATYLLGAWAYFWLQRMFIMGVSNLLTFWVMVSLPAVLMLIGLVSILKSGKKA